LLLGKPTSCQRSGADVNERGLADCWRCKARLEGLQVRGYRDAHIRHHSAIPRQCHRSATPVEHGCCARSTERRTGARSVRRTSRKRGRTVERSRWISLDPGNAPTTVTMNPFNGHWCDECRTVNQFFSLDRAKRIIETFRNDYNEHGPHSAVAALRRGPTTADRQNVRRNVSKCHALTYGRISGRLS
jgi:hypothetical protein